MRELATSEPAEGDAGAAKPSLQDGVGLGIDIIGIERMERVLERSPRFRTRVFTEAERAYCDKTSQPAVHYATRFAAKQAVLKTLGLNCLSGIDFRDIEIIRTSKGRPVVKLRKKARKTADEMGVLDMPISLSFTHSEAVGCAMAITMDSVSAAKKRVDPMKELARQFKQARLMLDDLPATDAGEAPVITKPANSPSEESQQPPQLGGLFE